MSEEKLPVCGCTQSHMYKVAYVLPLISELFIRVCGCVCVCVCVCVRACVCVCVLIVVSMVMRWDTIAQARRFTVAKQYQSSFSLISVEIFKHVISKIPLTIIFKFSQYPCHD